MSRIRKLLGALALMAVAAVFGVAAIAITRPAEAALVAAVDLHGGRGACGEAGLAAAAQALGLTTAELRTQLWGGQSLADLATAAGVDLATVQTAVNAACVQVNKDTIAQAVTAGTLTQDKADWLIEGLEKGFWGTSTSDGGFGFGRGGFGGFGHGGHGPGNPNDNDADDVTPTPAPTS